MTTTNKVHGIMDAGQYDDLIRTIVPSQPLLLSTIIDNFPGNCKRILELGCGTGILTAMIRAAQPVAEITGIDLSPEMLEVASEKPGLEGVNFLARDLREPWPEGKFDAIVSSLCLHHIPPGDRKVVVQRATSALTHCGRFICGDIYRAANDWEEQVLTESWARAMKREGAPVDVIEGMLRQRAGRISELSTIASFQNDLTQAGFSRVWVPFRSGFVGLVVGEIPNSRSTGDGVKACTNLVVRDGAVMCRP